jgi:hypothetical protein
VVLRQMSGELRGEARRAVIAEGYSSVAFGGESAEGRP